MSTFLFWLRCTTYIEFYKNEVKHVTNKGATTKKKQQNKNQNKITTFAHTYRKEQQLKRKRKCSNQHLANCIQLFLSNSHHCYSHQVLVHFFCLLWIDSPCFFFSFSIFIKATINAILNSRPLFELLNCQKRFCLFLFIVFFLIVIVCSFKEPLPKPNMHSESNDNFLK